MALQDYLMQNLPATHYDPPGSQLVFEFSHEDPLEIRLEGFRTARGTLREVARTAHRSYTLRVNSELSDATIRGKIKKYHHEQGYSWRQKDSSNEMLLFTGKGTLEVFFLRSKNKGRLQLRETDFPANR